MLVCLYEDRLHELVGPQLLVLSLRRHCPEWDIRLRIPFAPEKVRCWFRRHADVEVITTPVSQAGSYNVKPVILLDALDTGADRCLWLDTDILVNGALDYIAQISASNIVVFTGSVGVCGWFSAPYFRLGSLERPVHPGSAELRGRGNQSGAQTADGGLARTAGVACLRFRTAQIRCSARPGVAGGSGRAECSPGERRIQAPLCAAPVTL
jgi:hypothetical protein